MCIFRPVTELDVHFQAGEAPDVDVQGRLHGEGMRVCRRPFPS
jgi:hypothetical protein